MGLSTKRQGSNWKNTGGGRDGMRKGKAPAPGFSNGKSSRGHTHDAGYSYADFAKTDLPTYGQGKGKGKGQP